MNIMCEAITSHNKEILKNNAEVKDNTTTLGLLPLTKPDRTILSANSIFTKSEHEYHFPNIPLPPQNHNYFNGTVTGSLDKRYDLNGITQEVNNGCYILKQEGEIISPNDLPFSVPNPERNEPPEDNQKYRPFVCRECGKGYTQKCHLTAHVRVHSGIKPHTCFQCGKSFTQKHSLNTHMLLHQSDRPHTCALCKKSFTLKHHLVAHEKVHTREKPFECSECGQSFPLKRHLVTHQKFHAGERPYICKECGESFALEEHLQHHSRFHGSINSFRCNNCGETFTRKFELMNHSRMYGHGYFPLICHVCGKEFLQKKTLVAHMHRMHENVSFNANQFHTKPLLSNQQPQQQHHQPQNQQQQQQQQQPTSELTCTRCPVKFNSREALHIHEKFHDGDTSIFNDLLVLSQQQMSLTNPGYGNPPKLPTTVSTASAPNNPNMNTFVNGLLTNYSLDKHKPYMCTFCSKAFSTKHGLYHHNKRHPEGTCTEKPFSCQTCGKAFRQTNYLLLHERVHMDRKAMAIAKKQQQELQQQELQQQQQQQELHHQQQQMVTPTTSVVSHSTEISTQTENHGDHMAQAQGGYEANNHGPGTAE